MPMRIGNSSKQFLGHPVKQPNPSTGPFAYTRHSVKLQLLPYPSHKDAPHASSYLPGRRPRPLKQRLCPVAGRSLAKRRQRRPQGRTHPRRQSSRAATGQTRRFQQQPGRAHRTAGQPRQSRKNHEDDGHGRAG